MPNISIKDVPDTWAQALRQRAARNHRSLQGELMAIIEQAALGEQTGLAAPARTSVGTVIGFDTHGQPIIRMGWKTIEQIAQEHRKRFPEPIQGGPLAVDIIREERDSR